MTFAILVLINIAVIIGGGETTDLVVDKVASTGKQLDRIEKKAEKETKINVNVNPIINFKPIIKVTPTIINKTVIKTATEVK